MKKHRHKKILELIEHYSVYNQEELVERLHECGFPVTQATVSRDIKELALIKVPYNGDYRYSVNTANQPIERLRSLFAQSVIEINRAINIVVIKCYAGMANAVCASLDNISWDGIAGTIAGDDTIFIAIINEEMAINFERQLKGFFGG